MDPTTTLFTFMLFTPRPITLYTHVSPNPTTTACSRPAKLAPVPLLPPSIMSPTATFRELRQTPAKAKRHRRPWSAPCPLSGEDRYKGHPGLMLGVSLAADCMHH
ncbi:hypothetical protein CCHR01_19400 [Colletotrichum chrysophilum]|uniref:Uncharacterized protein n=1 Tax=Colletotrichum chrysophilum TaxID=1836956 RepID=A0AAD9EAG1_9PEZI|nr:hypothetical protein CCHR01_19400 [Colletotrichum chrysophilum]